MRLSILFLFVVSMLPGQPLEKGKKLFEEKKYEDARKLLVSVKDDHKDYAASRYYLGRIAAQFVQAYKVDPQFVQNLANFYIREKRFDNAFA